MNDIKIKIFFHSTLGLKNSTLFVKDILNEYFSQFSAILTEAYIVASVTDKKNYHNTPVYSHIKVNIINSSSYFKKLLLIYKEVKTTDLCFIFMPCKTSVIATIFCLLMKKKYIAYFGSHWASLEKVKKNSCIFKTYLKRRFSFFVSKHSDFAFFTGSGIQSEYKNHVKQSLLTIPIVNIDRSKFFRRPYYPYLFEKKTIKLLFVGSINENKGIKFLIQSLGMIQKENIFLDIIGPGEKINNYIILTESLGLQDRVTFHGYLNNDDNLLSFYRNADIFILPSFSEGMPRVLYEAMSQGVPVITTPVNSIPYLFEDVKDCLFIEPGNARDIASKINMLIDEKDLNSYLANNAYKKIIPIFNETAAEQHTRIIRQIYIHGK